MKKKKSLIKVWMSLKRIFLRYMKIGKLIKKLIWGLKNLFQGFYWPENSSIYMQMYNQFLNIYYLLSEEIASQLSRLK